MFTIVTFHSYSFPYLWKKYYSVLLKIPPSLNKHHYSTFEYDQNFILPFIITMHLKLVSPICYIATP